MGSSQFPTKSTEFVRLDRQTESGPDLLYKFSQHCITKIMRDGFPVDKFVLIGGETTLKTTLIVHVPKNFTSGDDFFMNNGPPLLHGRYYHRWISDRN